MHPAKKALAFAVSSLFIVFVGLALLNRLQARSPFIRKALGVA